MWNLFTFYLLQRDTRRKSVMYCSERHAKFPCVRKKHKNVSPNKRLVNIYLINIDLFLICNLQIQSAIADIKL